jgi:hypothetical protein
MTLWSMNNTTAFGPNDLYPIVHDLTELDDDQENRDGGKNHDKQILISHCTSILQPQQPQLLVTRTSSSSLLQIPTLCSKSIPVIPAFPSATLPQARTLLQRRSVSLSDSFTKASDTSPSSSLIPWRLRRSLSACPSLDSLTVTTEGNDSHYNHNLTTTVSQEEEEEKERASLNFDQLYVLTRSVGKKFDTTLFHGRLCFVMIF